MRIERVEPVGKTKVRICMEDDSVLVLQRRDAVLRGLKEEAEISGDVLAELMEQQRKECLRRSGTLLKDRDYSVTRLRGKLLEAGFDPGIVEDTVGSLMEAGYLDDDRFASGYVQYHLRDRSENRIRHDLMQQGLSRECIDRAFSGLDREDTSRAQEEQVRVLLKKKGYDPALAGWEEKQKMMAFLSRKGYENGLIRRIMDEI